jgi:hypothetical protein
MSVKFGLKQITYVSLGTALGLFLVSVEASAQTLTPQNVGPSISVISTDYKEPKSSPFADYKLVAPPPNTGIVVVPPVVVTATPLPLPSFEERDLAWRERRNQAVNRNIPSPSVSEKYLIDEVKILGLYQKSEGQGVFLRPTLAASTTNFAMAGQKFWNGEIKKINKDSIEVEQKILLNTGKTKTEVRIIPFIRK